MTVSPSPEQLSELDADSGMSGDAVAQAEMVWANLPTRNLPWTSLATHEKALVCHTLARLTADALESAQAEIARLTTELTPNDDTKYAFIGEFSFTRRFVDDNGYEQGEEIEVPWPTIKEIMAAILARAALKDSPNVG
jgi:hypothetical protein